MKISSTAFQEGKSIPAKYTCDGKNISPPLHFENIPPGCKSLVLIMDDIDVPEHIRKDRLWVHWLIYNMPPTTHTIAEGATPPGIQGANTYGHTHYDGPCPPDREHRYFFKLYALSTTLDLPPAATKSQIEHAMAPHILSTTQLIGLYKR